MTNTLSQVNDKGAIRIEDRIRAAIFRVDISR